MRELIGLNLSKLVAFVFVNQNSESNSLPVSHTSPSYTDNNKIQGVFPQTLAAMKKLEVLKVSNNQIEGFDGIGIWKRLPNLHVVQIKGFVGDWGDVPNLQELDCCTCIQLFLVNLCHTKMTLFSQSVHLSLIYPKRII
jgi:hypothetical protein